MSQSATQGHEGHRGNENDPPAVPAKVTYCQLELNRRQIRILHLFPSDDGYPIRCELRTAFLDDDPWYQALSYAWGDPLDTRPIEVNGQTTSVTVNLFNALRRLRDRRRIRRLWVDALCINQSDNSEKSHQVNLMKDIYSKTAKALLWLGDFSDDQDAVPGPRDSAAAVNQIPRQAAEATFALLDLIAGGSHFDINNEEADKELIHKGFDALPSLMQLSWWHRAWTVQEAVLPKRATFLCGAMPRPFSLVLLVYNQLQEHLTGGCCPICPNILGEFLGPTLGLTYAKQVQDKPESLPFLFNLLRARQASDPRDRVYAYLSLGVPMAADYSLTHQQIFILWSRSLVEESGNLFPLLRTTEIRQSSNLPTWVPDWCAEVNQEDYRRDWTRLQFYHKFHAAGPVKAIAEASPTGLTLDLQGLVLDQVMDVGDILSTEESFIETVASWQDIGKTTGAPDSQEYPRGGTYGHAAWCTVQGGFLVPKEGYAERITSTDDAEATFMETLKRDGPIGVFGYNQRGFSTREGMIGLGTRDVRVGDVVCILLGGNMPFILRKVDACRSSVACYLYIGQAYVHGIMDGEALEEGRELEWISLV